MGRVLQHSGVPTDFAEIVLRDQLAVAQGHAARVTDAVRRVTGRDARRFADHVAGAAATWRAA